MKQLQKEGFHAMTRREQQSIKGGLIRCFNDSDCGPGCDYEFSTVPSALFCYSGYCRRFACML
jgi:hypothetical protein